MLYALLDDLRKQYDEEKSDMLIKAIRRVEKEIAHDTSR